MTEQTKSLRDIVSFQTRDAGGGSGAGRTSMSGGGLASRMRMKVMIAGGFALLCAGIAVALSNMWFASQMDRMNPAEGPTSEVVRMPTRTVVVASTNVAFGAELTESNLTEIEWPADSVPDGTFERVDQVVSAESRYALAALSRNEAVLHDEVSAPGQRASLSAMLAPGMKAVAIRVDEVLGVAGLIQPGDRVDVIWTRDGTSREGETYAEVLLEHVRVLAIDQRVETGDEAREARTDVARAVTIEVDVLQAQAVALASTTGKLLLALRDAGMAVYDESRRVTVTDLGVQTRMGQPPVLAADGEPAAAVTGETNFIASSNQLPGGQPILQRRRNRYVVIGVRRGLERSEYNVMSSQR